MKKSRHSLESLALDILEHTLGVEIARNNLWEKFAKFLSLYVFPCINNFNPDESDLLAELERPNKYRPDGMIFIKNQRDAKRVGVNTHPAVILVEVEDTNKLSAEKIGYYSIFADLCYSDTGILGIGLFSTDRYGKHQAIPLDIVHIWYLSECVKEENRNKSNISNNYN